MKITSHVEKHISEGGSRRFGSKQGYGLKISDKAPAKPAFTTHKLGAGAIAAGLALGLVSLREFGCPIMDQGAGDFGTSSCTGHAEAGADYTTRKAQGRPLAQPNSPHNYYTLGREEENQDPSAPLTDDGADPDMVTLGASKFGTRPMRSPTSDGRFSDCEPANINEKSKLDELVLDDQAKSEGAYHITGTSLEIRQQIQAALRAGYAIKFAIMVDEAFENWDGSAPLKAPDPNKILGGHALYMDGLETRENGTCLVYFANSWGKDLWGLSGYAVGDDSFIDAMQNITVVVAQEAS